MPVRFSRVSTYIKLRYASEILSEREGVSVDFIWTLFILLFYICYNLLSNNGRRNNHGVSATFANEDTTLKLRSSKTSL